MSAAPQAPAASVHTLGTLLKRSVWHHLHLHCVLVREAEPSRFAVRDSLEAATSRLEDIALAQQSQQTIGHIPGPSALPVAAPAGADAPPRAGTSGVNAGASSSATSHNAASQGSNDSPAISAYKELLAGPLDKYAGLSKDIGGVVAEQVRFMREGAQYTA
jgi:hypothetical protein